MAAAFHEKEAAAVRERVPIIIGITGKRDLQGKDELVRKALDDVFDDLDDRFRDSPKLLLTGLAAGADTIAAEEALSRADWRVVAVLSLELNLYLQDFDGAGAARLRQLLANPKLGRHCLAPLRDLRTGRPFEPNELARSADGNPNRTAHYEQAGLFIVQHCALLIAVMPAGEQPVRVGGTARIVAYRLSGRPDDIAKDVIRRSAELCMPLAFDRPHQGPVWLIDLAALDDGPAGAAPSDVLLPADSSAERVADEESRIEQSLELLGRIDSINRRVHELSDEVWRRDVLKRAGPDLSGPAGLLRIVRLALSAIQVRTNARVRKAVWGLAALFIAAVFLLEVYIEFKAVWAIALYVVVVAVALLLYRLARSLQWQPRAEDDRAISEALRVQLAWWEAGVIGPGCRADRYYLRGLAGSLGLVRASVRQVIAAALLGASKPMPVAGADRKWIEGQISFFEQRCTARHRSLWRVEAISWFLFVTALGAAIFLAIVSVCPYGPVHELANHARRYPGVTCSAALIVIAVMFGPLAWPLVAWTPQRLLAYSRQHEENPAFVYGIWWFVCLAAGFLIAFALYDAAFAVERLAHAKPDPHWISEHGERFVIIAVVALAAVAAGVRFVAEKLSWEAEAHRYAEALEIFRTARAELDAMAAKGAEADEDSRAALLLELGKNALEENEAWIRTHRERPLEPVVGA